MLRILTGVWLTLFCLPMLSPAGCLGDVVYLQDGTILFGRVLEQQPETVIFDQRIDAGTTDYRRKIIRRSDITAIVTNIDPVRLEETDPGNPASYRDLAEELLPQHRDPEARDLAIRLFLLAAKYGDAELRPGCFSGLIALARSPEEEKRFRALAFVHLGDRARWHVPESRSTRQAEDTAVSKQQQEQLLDAITLLRRGQRQEAAIRIGQEWARNAIAPFDDICSWQELQQWCSEPELKTEWLARVLELEIALGNPARHSNPADHRGSSSTDWSQLAAQSKGGLAPVDFSNVAEFDLDQNVFHAGKWTTNK